jgi:hypothetical protein
MTAIGGVLRADYSRRLGELGATEQRHTRALERVGNENERRLRERRLRDVRVLRRCADAQRRDDVLPARHRVLFRLMLRVLPSEAGGRDVCRASRHAQWHSRSSRRSIAGAPILFLASYRVR